MTDARSDPDRDPKHHQPGKANPDGIRLGKESLRRQATWEATLNQGGDKPAADFLSDENDNITKIRADTVPEGDPQEAQRGQGQEIPS